MMELFKVGESLAHSIACLHHVGFLQGTLRLHASDRLTTEACVQSQAFMSINRKQKDERLKRKQPRPYDQSR